MTTSSPAPTAPLAPGARGIAGSVVRRLRKLPQYTRTSRHLRSLLWHSTPRRLWNLGLVELEYRLRRTNVRGHPYVLIVDPTNVCNLRCPLCPTGLLDQGRPAQMMPWETFTRAIDQLAPWAYEVNLYSWGESILHPHVYEMIAYARSKNLATLMSANMNEISDEGIDRLVNSGLEHLCLSIDGVTEETYTHYRRRGRLETVLANVRKLVERRRALGSRTPILEWQFIVMKHNAHEIEAARRLAEQMGVDEFRLIPVGIPFDSPDPEGLKREWFPVLPDGRQGDFRSHAKGGCFYLYRSFTVNPDGRTSPCCVVNGEKNDFGDLLHDDFAQIWNNDRYLSARAQFRSNGQARVPTVCDRCELFEKASPAAPPPRVEASAS